MCACEFESARVCVCVYVCVFGVCVVGVLLCVCVCGVFLSVDGVCMGVGRLLTKAPVYITHTHTHTHTHTYIYIRIHTHIHTDHKQTKHKQQANDIHTHSHTTHTTHTHEYHTRMLCTWTLPSTVATHMCVASTISRADTLCLRRTS